MGRLQRLQGQQLAQLGVNFQVNQRRPGQLARESDVALLFGYRALTFRHCLGGGSLLSFGDGQAALALCLRLGSGPLICFCDGQPSLDFGFRLRYLIRRELAPYAGVVWHQKHFGTADLARANGESTGGARFVAGLRFWM